jgi:hypothetical protein
MSGGMDRDKYSEPTVFPRSQMAGANGDTNPKKAFGIMKPSTFAIPGSAIFALGKVLAFGAKKYGLFNWRKDPVDYQTYYDAIMRHLDESKEGSDADPDTNEDPLAHIMACCAIVIDAKKHGCLVDNRPKEIPHG